MVGPLEEISIFEDLLGVTFGISIGLFLPIGGIRANIRNMVIIKIIFFSPFNAYPVLNF